MNSDVELVKARLSIADVVRRYVDLRPVSGRWTGPCPFHQETKPSFSVNDDEGFFYCFGCQASGDVIDFYMRINGLEFRDALEQLAQEAGVQLSGAHRHDPQAELRKQRKKIFLDMHTRAARWFAENLSRPAGAEASAYLDRRGISPETRESFTLGASPADWHGLDAFLRSEGFTPEQAVECGLLSKNDNGNIYDRFRERLIFPIQNLSGQVIAFGGRVINEGGPKYLNSSDSPIYKKGEHLYGLFQARRSMNRTRRALLTEGYMDVLSLHQFGYQDACGVLGTALTPEQVRRLAGLCTRVDLLFDGDAAGRKAALRSTEMILLAGVKCSVVLLPEGEDVDSILQTRGREGFERFLENAGDGLRFATSMVQEEFAPKDIMSWATNFLAGFTEPTLLAYYLPRVAQGLGVGEAELRSAVGARPAPRSASQRQAGGQADAAAQGHGGHRQVEKEDLDDRLLLEFPIRYPEYVEDLEGRGFGAALQTTWARNMWAKIVRQQGGDLVSMLSEGEKRLYTRCRMEREEHLLTGHDLLDEWRHVCSLIEQKRARASKGQLKDKIRAAQEAGDLELANKYLKALLDAPRRDDEQH
jgi:DNA primase